MVLQSIRFKIQIELLGQPPHNPKNGVWTVWPSFSTGWRINQLMTKRMLAATMTAVLCLAFAALVALDSASYGDEIAVPPQRALDEAAQAHQLIDAVLMEGDVASLQKLLSQGLDVNSRGKAGLTAYQAALLHGESGLARFLADHGARTNAPMPSPARIADAFFSEAISNHAPGAAVLVAQNGRVLFKKGYGLLESF